MTVGQSAWGIALGSVLLASVLLTSGCSPESDATVDDLESLSIESSGLGSRTVSAEIEYNGARALVTALHCVGDNAYVDAPSLSARLPVIERFDAYDLALLQPLESIRLPSYPVAAFPASGVEACKVGTLVKNDCGPVVGPGEVDGTVVMMIDICSVPGDSGSAITWNGTLVGVEGGDVSYAPGFDENLPCNSVEQSRMNPLYSLGLPEAVIGSAP
jgi:hypothetical protein